MHQLFESARWILSQNSTSSNQRGPKFKFHARNFKAILEILTFGATTFKICPTFGVTSLDGNDGAVGETAERPNGAAESNLWFKAQLVQRILGLLLPPWAQELEALMTSVSSPRRDGTQAEMGRLLVTSMHAAREIRMLLLASETSTMNKGNPPQ